MKLLESLIRFSAFLKNISIFDLLEQSNRLIIEKLYQFLKKYHSLH